MDDLGIDMVYDLLYYILLSTHHSLDDEIQNFEYCLLDAQSYPIQYPTHYLLAFSMKFGQLKQIRTKLLVLSSLLVFFVRVVMFRRTTQFITEVHPWTCFPFLQAPMWLMKQTTLFISIWIRKRFYSLSLASPIVVAKKLTTMRFVLWLCSCIQSSMYHCACIFDVM